MDLSGLKRSLQLTGLAKDMVLLQARRHGMHEAKMREHLIERLGHLHGLPQKMAQILSLNELTSTEQAFTPLTEYPTTLPLEEIKAEIKSHFGKEPEELFAWLDPTGISASLGQVHAARLHNGRKVAVKVQYPGMHTILETDLKALGWLSAPVGGMKKGFDLEAYQKEMHDMLMLELDYLHEAEMQQEFYQALQNRPEYELPVSIPSLSNQQILTMSWLEGNPFEHVKNWSGLQRKQLAEQILNFFLNSCFQWHRLHSDPHPGNYRFRLENQQPVLGLLDFGCVKKLNPLFVQHFQILIWEFIQGSTHPSQIFEHFLAMGFKEDFLGPMRLKLEPLCKHLFAPFLTAKPFDLRAWKLGEGVTEILGDDRWNFRFAGPASLLFFIRSYQGLLQYLKALDIEISWQAFFEQTVPKRMTQSPEMKTVKTETLTKDGAAQNLCIRLKRGGETKVLMKFQACMASELVELVPDEIKPLLDEKKIDLSALQAQAIQGGFCPGTLFEIEDKKSNLKVWLD